MKQLGAIFCSLLVFATSYSQTKRTPQQQKDFYTRYSKTMKTIGWIDIGLVTPGFKACTMNSKQLR